MKKKKLPEKIILTFHDIRSQNYCIEIKYHYETMVA